MSKAKIREGLVEVERNQREKTKTNKLKKNKGSMTVESAIIFPLCFFLIFFMLRLGIVVYDSYTMSLVCMEWVEQMGNQRQNVYNVRELEKRLQKRMIYPKEIEVNQEISALEFSMDYHPLWKIQLAVETPVYLKERLYHFLNARQLIDRIPALQESWEKYLESIRKLKKPRIP